MQGAGLPVDKEGHRHAPLALARQRPVGTIGDHAVQARLAPGGIEAGRLHAPQRGGTQGLRGFRALVSGHLVHAREPLGRGAVDDRGPVAPAVHIAVRVLFRMKQGARFADLLDDPGIRRPDVQSAEKRQRRSVFPVAQHRGENLLVLHAVAAAGNEVIDAVSRSAVDDARTLRERHVLAEVDGRETVVEGMAEADQLELFPLAGGERPALQPIALEAGLLQVGGEDQQAALGLDEVVDEIRMDVERLVRGNRPRRGGPYEDPAFVPRQLGQAERLRHLAALGERKSHVDRKIGAIHVFDLGLGERRAAIEAPVHRFQAAIDKTFLQHLAERADLIGLALERHRGVEVVPVAEHAQALEVLFLSLDLLGRIRAGEAQGLFHGNVLAVGLLDLHLDRHAVAVPAGDVDRVEARHVARLHDNVLEDLVDRLADVDVAVRVRRPVVQHEFRPSAARLADLFVGFLLLPFLDPLRLPSGKVTAHGKGRIRKIQRFLVVGLVFRHCGDP